MDEKGLLVGISGASGAIYGIRLLETLKIMDIKSFLILSREAEKIIQLETSYSVAQIKEIATVCFDPEDTAAPVSSGSFNKTLGMVILPCSIKTLSALANSYNVNLLIRAADVILKEGRRLVVCPREAPLHYGHLELMLRLSNMGALLFPPIPAFYHRPQTIEEIIDQSVGKILDLFDIESPNFKRWAGKDQA
ncbi:MAG TPA: UbiX family flavin prenyltransferase [Thermodesulfobacteriota bacterium]|nr:UbiX family flavin prenyltransferase [Thermodesulfobacteriota bacterium]